MELKSPSKSKPNSLAAEDCAVHDWYRFVLSFPPHLVRHYLQQFNVHSTQQVLDPFCGTGTTLVECKKLGIPSIGLEANPVAHFATQVKIDWSFYPDELWEHANIIAQQIQEPSDHLRSLSAHANQLLLKNSISPKPLHRVLSLLDKIQRNKDDRFFLYERLALAKTSVFTASNLSFGPEVGVGRLKDDAPVETAWLTNIQSMCQDMNQLSELANVPTTVHFADSRQISSILESKSIDAVITSPPYPNEKDYTRITRLESVLLGFIRDRAELQALKRGLIRSNTRNVYKGDTDDFWVEQYSTVQEIAQTIENRRLELGKTSGFEKLYGTVTKQYFGGMARHLAELRSALRPGAQLAYVVGDQASYFRIMIHTGQLLAEIAQNLGYELIGIDLFRTRLSTATREQLREEVVVLRWPG
jgi:DNA modification methylase